MAGITKEIYSALEAGGSVTAISLEGGELNIFGSTYTGIELGEVKPFPRIKDDLTSLAVVDNTDKMFAIGKGIANALMIAAGCALFAASVVATGGATLALAGVVLGGASIGARAAVSGMVENDKKTGYDRSWGEFALGMGGGILSGAVTGAMLYSTVMSAPAAGIIAGAKAGTFFGASLFTQTTVPAIITNGIYGVAATTAVFTANDIYAGNGGYNYVLDKVFNNNIIAYRAFDVILQIMNMAVSRFVQANVFRLAEKEVKKGIQFVKGKKYSPINPGPLDQQTAESFNGAIYTKRILSEDTVMYRVYGGSSGKVGSYVTTTPQGGGLQSQLDLALNPSWGNTAENITTAVVPQGTIIYEGTAAPQNIYDSLNNVTGTLPGGGTQIFIPAVEEGWFQ